MRLRYTLPALADLGSILDHIESVSPQSTKRVQKRIQDVINLLPSHPEIGIRTDDLVIRRLTTPPYPFLIFYEIAEDEIIIHAIRDAARNPSGMPGFTRSVKGQEP